MSSKSTHHEQERWGFNTLFLLCFPHALVILLISHSWLWTMQVSSDFIYICVWVCWTNWPCFWREIFTWSLLALVWVWSFIRCYWENQVILSPSPTGFQNAVILLIAQPVDMCEYVGLNFGYLIPKTLHCTCAVVHSSKTSNQMCCLPVILFCLTW